MHTVMAKQKGVYLLVKKVRVSHPYHMGTYIFHYLERSLRVTYKCRFQVIRYVSGKL